MACGTDGDSDGSQRSEDVAPDVSNETDGDGQNPLPALEPSADLETLELESGTVACREIAGVIEREIGTTLVFCVDPEERSWSIVEGGHLDVPYVPYERAEKCADELFQDLSDDQPVPPVLEEVCEGWDPSGFDWQEAEEEAGAERSVFEDARQNTTRNDDIGLTTPRDMRAHYCGGSGASNFLTERCGFYNHGSGFNQYFCQTNLVTWHQRTSSQKAYLADGTTASCNATTRFRYTRRKNAYPYTWQTQTDVEVSPNYYYNIYSLTHSKYYKRFRGDSYTGASHRYTGVFDW